MSTGGVTSTLLRKLLEQRESWCVLRPASDSKPALRVLVRRPPEADYLRFSRAGSRGSTSMVELIAEFTVGWEGFTEAELLGASVGSSDPLPFDGSAWLEVLRDRLEWLDLVGEHITTAVADCIERKKAAAKN